MLLSFLLYLALASTYSLALPLEDHHPSGQVIHSVTNIMTTSAEKKETVILETSDDEQFTVEKRVAERSAMIKTMLEGELEALTPSVLVSSPPLVPIVQTSPQAGCPPSMAMLGSL